MDITVYGARNELHSGHYERWLGSFELPPTKRTGRRWIFPLRKRSSERLKARGPAIKILSSGGGNPDAAGDVLKMPSIGVPIANHDDNQHSYNENLRIQNLWDGIELMAALLTM